MKKLIGIIFSVVFLISPSVALATSSSESVDVFGIGVGCGPQNLTFYGTAKYTGDDEDHLLVTLDGTTVLHSHSEPEFWATANPVAVSVGNHTLVANVYDDPEDGSPDQDQDGHTVSHSDLRATDTWNFTVPACQVGAQGPAGPQGPQGSQGSTGSQGIQGDKGDTGDQGLIGLNGPQGDPGENGSNGLNGLNGINCWDLNSTGINDSSEDTNNDESYSALDCQGLKGDQGDQGPQGTQGPAGPAGPQGPQGGSVLGASTSAGTSLGATQLPDTGANLSLLPLGIVILGGALKLALSETKRKEKTA